MQFQRLQDKRSMAFDRARSLAIVADDGVCQQEHVRLPPCLGRCEARGSSLASRTVAESLAWRLLVL